MGRNEYMACFAALLSDYSPAEFSKNPPLSLDQAVKIAERRMVPKGAEKTAWIVEIIVKPFSPAGDRKYGGIYYYNILFGGIGLVGHYERCIILMDGTVVEPELLGAKRQHYNPWDFDE